MSRVEEAFRRAAQAAADRSSAIDKPKEATCASEFDPDVLTREPYPLETSAPRSEPRKPATVTSFPPATVARPEPVRPDSQNPESLFDRLDDSVDEKVVVDRNTDPASREQYRRLAATLHHAQSVNGMKVILITSAVQSEGKSLTATNLALTFSESYQRRVLLIDADLRRPTLHTIFKIENASGLCDGLISREERRLPVRQASPRLAVLPAGQPTGDPMAGLTSARMRQLINEARETFDWVIIDTPPVVLLPDANLLGSMADAVVLIVKAESTSYDLVNRALNAIGRDRVLGIVLNQSHSGGAPEGYAYYASYSGASRSAGYQ